MPVAKLLGDLETWALTRQEIRAIVLVGSHARGAARPDSDLDVVILSEAPHSLLNDLAWTKLFGTVARQEREGWGRLTSIRVFYEDGLEVEFGITSLEWASALDVGTLAVLDGGFRVLLDRDSLLGSFERKPS